MEIFHVVFWHKAAEREGLGQPCQGQYICAASAPKAVKVVREQYKKWDEADLLDFAVTKMTRV